MQQTLNSIFEMLKTMSAATWQSMAISHEHICVYNEHKKNALSESQKRYFPMCPPLLAMHFLNLLGIPLTHF